MKMERSYRQSGVKRFKRCRRSYDLGYRQNLTISGESSNFSKTRDVGTMYHAGLQAYYLHQDPLGAVERSGTEFLEKYSGSAEAVKGIKMARTMIEGYVQWQEDTGLDQGWEVLMVEKRLELPIGEILGDQVVLSGQLDMAIRDGNGDVYVLDDKTCDQFEKYTFNIQMSEQLLFYDMLLRRVDDLEPAGAIYNMARRVLRTAASNPPYYSREVVRFNNTQRTNYENQLIGQVTDMVRAEQAVEADPDAHQQAMYPSPTGDCKWDCDFLTVCSMRDTGEAFDDALADMYVQRTPVEISTKKDVA